MNNELQTASSNDVVKRNCTLRGMIDALEGFPLDHHVDGDFSVTDLHEGGGPKMGYAISLGFFGPDRNIDPEKSFSLEYDIDEYERFLEDADLVRDIIFSRSISFKYVFDYYEGEKYFFDEDIKRYVFKL